MNLYEDTSEYKLGIHHRRGSFPMGRGSWDARPNITILSGDDEHDEELSELTPYSSGGIRGRLKKKYNNFTRRHSTCILLTKILVTLAVAVFCYFHLSALFQSIHNSELPGRRINHFKN